MLSWLVILTRAIGSIYSVVSTVLLCSASWMHLRVLIQLQLKLQVPFLPQKLYPRLSPPQNKKVENKTRPKFPHFNLKLFTTKFLDEEQDFRGISGSFGIPHSPVEHIHKKKKQQDFKTFLELLVEKIVALLLK